MKKLIYLIALLMFQFNVSNAQTNKVAFGSTIHLGFGNDFKPDNGVDYTNRSYGNLTVGAELYAAKGIMKYSALFLNSSEFLTTFNADPSHSFNQYGFMLGNSFGNDLKWHYQAGIGGVFGKKRGERVLPCESNINEFHAVKYRTVGFPLRTGVVWWSSPSFGTGLDLIANLNSESTMWSVALTFHMGQHN